VVVLAECTVAHFFLPAAAGYAPQKEVSADPEAEIRELLEAEASKAVESSENLVEIDLGDYDVTSYQPSSGTALRIGFHLYGTLEKEKSEGFNEAMEACRHRVRDQVLIIVRSAEMADLADPGLGLIKRKILEKTNAALGRPMLHSVVFSDFSFIEQ
jgi:flagellar FliL protein